MPRSGRLHPQRLIRLALSGVLLSGFVGLSQQQVPFRNGIPVAPDGLRTRPLPDRPMEFDTAEEQDIRVVVVARGLTYPWSLAFLPDGEMLVTERTGKLRIIRNGVLDPEPVPGVPASRYSGVSGLPGAVHGLMDIALHPTFEENRFVYFTYTKPFGDEESTIALARARWSGEALENVRDIFITEGGSGASRIAFAPDGTLFMTVGGRGSQDPANHAGKILRLHDDGGVPGDNPFVGREGYRPAIYSLGHRTSLGLAVHPGTGEVWQNENGPNGGDEINVLKPGAHYGWPMVSLGRDYEGNWHSERFQQEGFEDPIVYWMPSIAVSGMTFYTGDALPRWKGDVFVGGLRMGEIPGTGHVERILFNPQMQELRREMLLVDLRQRIRDIRMGPDELLYVLTGENDGAVLRIEPAE